MKKKIVSFRIILLFVCCSNMLFVSKSFSQDFHLSQFDAFAQYLNPAMTGMFDGDYRINVQTRRQWASVIPNPFVTTCIGFDMSHLNMLVNPKLKKIKIGAYVINESAGTSKYNTFNFALSGAYDIAIKQSNHHILMGLQLGFINKSVNTSALNYGSQYSNNDGGGFNTTLPSGETFNGKSIAAADMNFGALYYYGNVKSRINPFIGGTVFHINQPKEQFLGDNNRLPMRFNINGGTKVNINRQNQVNLHFLVMKEQNVTEADLNVMGMTFIRNRDDVCLLYGFGYRYFLQEIGKQKDAGIIHLGMKYGNITGRVSYDINVSSFKTYTNRRGGFEISLIYIHSKPIKIPALTCPRI